LVSTWPSSAFVDAVLSLSEGEAVEISTDSMIFG